MKCLVIECTQTIVNPAAEIQSFRVCNIYRATQPIHFEKCDNEIKWKTKQKLFQIVNESMDQLTTKQKQQQNQRKNR